MLFIITRKPYSYLKIVLAFDEELDENLGSNNSSIFLQNNLLKKKTQSHFSEVADTKRIMDTEEVQVK